MRTSGVRGAGIHEQARILSAYDLSPAQPAAISGIVVDLLSAFKQTTKRREPWA